MVAEMDAGKDRVLIVYACLVALAVGVMLVRMLRDRARPVQVGYEDGQTAQGRRGLSVLEISLAGDVAHAHVCSGRGRCGTCRVQVEQGAQSLSPVNDLEETTLARVHAPAGARLACQARVFGPGVVVTRLLPAYADASAAREPASWALDGAPGLPEPAP
jgi:adenylate cyclase